MTLYSIKICTVFETFHCFPWEYKTSISIFFFFCWHYYSFTGWFPHQCKAFHFGVINMHCLYRTIKYEKKNISYRTENWNSHGHDVPKFKVYVVVVSAVDFSADFCAPFCFHETSARVSASRTTLDKGRRRLHDVRALARAHTFPPKTCRLKLILILPQVTILFW